MEQALSYLTVLPSTADEIKRFSSQIINQVKSGEENPLKLLVLLRALESTAETIRKGIEDNILTEVGKYSEKSFEAFGARVEKSEVGVVYDYASCGDRDWFQFKIAEETAGNRRKEREIFLRALREPMDLFEESTGEIYEIRPPLKKSKSGVKVFLK
jgi:hypothetical protein